MSAHRTDSPFRTELVGQLAQATVKCQQASALHVQGQFDAAQAGYLEVLRLAPDHFEALHLLGTLHYQTGNAAAAVELIQHAIRLEPNHAAPYAHLGLAFQSLGRSDEALHHFDLALARDPRNLPALNNRGNTLNHLGQANAALADFDRLLALDPKSAEALTNRGLVLQALGRSEEALNSHELALQLQPEYAKALNNRGNVLRELGRLEDAQASFKRALALYPNFAEAHNNLGVTLREMKRLREALSSFERALALQPNLVEALNNFGMTQRELGRPEEALVSYRQVLQLRPDDAQGWSNCGCALYDMQRQDEALECFERALRLQPNAVGTLNNRGNALLALGQREAALVSYQQALHIALVPAAQRPGGGSAAAGFESAVTHSNLSYLYNVLGRYETAEVHARQAIALDARLPDAYFGNLAQAEAGRLRYGTALQVLDTMQEFAPRHTSALITRSQILRQSERFDEALDYAGRAVETILPQHLAKAHIELGRTLQAMNRHDEAMLQFERAAAWPGQAAEEALIGCATLLLEQGRKAEAMATFDRALAILPASTRVLIDRADAKTFQVGDPDIAALEALFAKSEYLPLSEPLAARFALGKAYLDLDEGDLAFKHFDIGNRQKRATYNYDSRAAAIWLCSIAASGTSQWLSCLEGSGATSELPVFVVGMPRSGMTLVEQILSSHAAVMGAGELSVLRLLIDARGELTHCMQTLTRDTAVELGEAYLAEVTPLAKGRSRLLDKMPANFLYAGLIAAILPGARIIHCRRDPIDTCLSCYTKLFGGEQLFAYDQTELGEFYLAYQELMAHWRKVLPASRMIEVAYEAVVDDLEGEARRLVDFLGLPWDETCLQFAENNRVVRTASMNQVRQPIYRGSMGRWRRYVSHLGPLLTALEGATPQ